MSTTNKNITSANVKYNCKFILSLAFSGCSSLTNVTLPEGLLSIASMAFVGCSNLNTMIIQATTPPTLGAGAIPTTISNIYVPSSSVELYKTASNWSTYADKISAI